MRFTVRGKDPDGTRLEMLVEARSPTGAVATARRMNLSEIYVRPAVRYETGPDGEVREVAIEEDYTAEGGGILSVRLLYILLLLSPLLIYGSLVTALAATLGLLLLGAMALPCFPLRVPDRPWGIELALTRYGLLSGKLAVVSLVAINWLLPLLAIALVRPLGWAWGDLVLDQTIYQETELLWPLALGLAVALAFHLVVTYPARQVFSDLVRDHAWRARQPAATGEHQSNGKG